MKTVDSSARVANIAAVHSATIGSSAIFDTIEVCTWSLF